MHRNDVEALMAGLAAGHPLRLMAFFLLADAAEQVRACGGGCGGGR
jgi:hypothetical protein